MSFELNIPRSRTTSLTGYIYEQDGTTPHVLAAGDKLRFKVYRGAAATPVLDILSGATLAGGTTISIDSVGDVSNPAQYTITFGQADIDAADVMYGPYDAELIVVDVSEGSSPELRNKHTEFGVVNFLHSGGGNLGP